MSRARKTVKRATKAAPAKVAASAPTPASGPMEVAASPEPQPGPELRAPVVAPAAAASAATAGLKLEASCTLRDSIDMQFQLLAVDFGDSDVLVDGSAVERIDTAGLQMLLSFAKHQATRGKPLRWTAASPELLRGSRLLGLDSALGLAETSSGDSARGN